MASEAKKPQGTEGLDGDQSALVPPTRATGAESATGQALADKHEVPQGDDRGSKQEPAGGQPASDWDIANGKGDAVLGAQAQLARFTSNGQLPHNTVPTPSGAVPVGATALSQEDAEAAVRDVNDAHDAYVNRGTERRKLAKETVQRLSVQDLRAIAEQRGYDIPEYGGTRAMREAFIRAQDADKDIKAAPKLNKPNTHGGAAGQAGALSDKAKEASAQASGGGLAAAANTLGKPDAKA